jgi:hypothetical protein
MHAACIRRLIAAFAFPLIALGLLGCEGDYRPEAVGPQGEVTVVMDSTRWKSEVGEAVRSAIGPTIETLPQLEPYFDLRQADLTDERTYDAIKQRKNVVFVAPLSDSTNEANFLRQRFSEDARQAVLDGAPAVIARPNLWRRNQRVFFITAATPEALASALQRRGSEVRQTFKEVTLERMEEEMFEKARQFNLEDTLMQRHGFAVNVQHDYQIAIDSTTEDTGFIWMRRVLADSRRELFFYYIDNASASRITPEWIYATRDSLTRRYLRGNMGGFTKIDRRRPLNTQQLTFLDRYAYETRGLWHMVQPVPTDDGGTELMGAGGGGPFLTYTFYDRTTDRIYLIDGSVFAPRYDKRPFLRQMEVIAHTFRTQAEADAHAQGTDDAVAVRRAPTEDRSAVE